MRITWALREIKGFRDEKENTDKGGEKREEKSERERKREKRKDYFQKNKIRLYRMLEERI